MDAGPRTTTVARGGGAQKARGNKDEGCLLLPLALHMGACRKGGIARHGQEGAHIYPRVWTVSRAHPKTLPPSLGPSPCCVHLVAEALSLCSHVVGFKQQRHLVQLLRAADERRSSKPDERTHYGDYLGRRLRIHYFHVMHLYLFVRTSWRSFC